MVALQMVQNDRLKSALEYHEMRFSVIPLHSVQDGRCSCAKGKNCPSKGKHPKLTRWEKFQTTPPTPKQIHNWWTSFPDANIGIITGAVSGIIILDVDPPDGEETLRELGLELPPTAVSRTGSGGLHYFFKYPGRHCPNSVGKIGRSLDVRGDGGLVVAAPSVNANGSYTWLLHPRDVGIAEPPKWLLEHIDHENDNRNNESKVTNEDWLQNVEEGGRNDKLARLAGSLFGRGLPTEIVMETLLAWNQNRCNPPLDKAEVSAVVNSISRLHEKNAETDAGRIHVERPETLIHVAQGFLPQVVAEAWRAVERTNAPPQIFQRAGEIVRITTNDNGTPVISALCHKGLKGHLARIARWVEYKKLKNGDEIPIDHHPPDAVVGDLLVEPAKPLPILNRIVEAPVFGRDGSLKTDPGYHEQSRSYYSPKNIKLQPVSQDPSQQEIDDAKHLLTTEYLGDFPFTSPSDVAHTLAAMFLPFVRELVDGPTPLHMISAPSPGTGKGLLADCIAIPATGRSMEVMTYSTSDEENRKRLTSTLLEAPVYVSFDNIVGTLSSPTLAAVLTSTTWKDRRLGKSENIALEITTTWVGTANSPTFSTEISRRIVRIQIDAKTAAPWRNRTFRHPSLRRWAQENRSKLVWAILTLVQAWVAKGMPHGNYDLGTYESYAAVMGGIFDAVGIKGFLSNLDQMYESADAETGEWLEFFTQWWTEHEDQPQPSRKLFELAEEWDLLLSIRGTGNVISQKTALGKALATMDGRRIGEFEVVRARKKGAGGTAIYQLRKTKEEAEMDWASPDSLW